MTPNYPMGNRTYANGDLTITPELTKEHSDLIEKRMTEVFGEWPEWAIIKPKWTSAYLGLIHAGEWEKLGDWQEQILIILKKFTEYGYYVVGTIDWEDETERATLHVDSSRKLQTVNTHWITVSCSPDWNKESNTQYPDIESGKNYIAL